MINKVEIDKSVALFNDISCLDVLRQEIVSMTDDGLLNNVIDNISELNLSSDIFQNMIDVTEAYRITLIQLIDQEMDNKAKIIDNIKIRT